MNIVLGRAYHWKNWCLARDRDCLYIWSYATTLEISNGWFSFILHYKPATMYSSGSTEGGSNSTENRGKLLVKPQQAGGGVRQGSNSTVLLRRGPSDILGLVVNWNIGSRKAKGLTVVNNNVLPGFLI